jgi:hypothetical protein
MAPMTTPRLLVLAALLTACSASGAVTARAPSAIAPRETGQLAPLIGRWRVTGASMQPDGSWRPNHPAEWNWSYVLDGHAVQDEYVSPPRDEPAPPEGRHYGLNVRMYDARTSQWNMAWVSNGIDPMATFTARMDAGRLIMRGRYKDRFDTRNVFYDIRPGSFRWKKELLLPDGSGGQRWVEVARLEATRAER